MIAYNDLPILTGDKIAWPVRRKSRMWMNSGTVEHVFDDHIVVTKDSTGRITRLKNARTVIVLRRAAI